MNEMYHDADVLVIVRNGWDASSIEAKQLGSQCRMYSKGKLGRRAAGFAPSMVRVSVP